jgi:hypothetical protein
MYKTCMAVVALRAQGQTPAVIAETLGHTPETIRSYMKHAVTKGWLNINSFHDPDDRVDYVLRDKVVRNFNEMLDARDKDVTLEVGKSFRYAGSPVAKIEGPAMIGMALKVQVEMPPALQSSPIQIRPLTIGGTQTLDIPLDAELVEEGQDGQDRQDG